MIMLNNKPLYVGNFKPIKDVIVPEPVLDEVTIGTQTWKTSYLAIDDGQGEINYNETTGLYYYSTTAANRVTATIEGWRLPTVNDIDTLLSYIGPQNRADLISADDGGTDIYGLGLRLAGMKYGGYGYIGTYGFIMTTTYLWMYGLNTNQYYNSSVRQGNIRLIKDAT